ncbi:oocyte zinc finger protein XlCOF19 [Sarcophilus harrisii]|uniref:C2H2-type domain-containing protein n=1 Tax=Sarcophilus harrisii TaxID=9305 RepID=A0A7N4NML1_SARHA|nr:oocyte zinc finger protein XlCOF19 [Sarcophilus harrisii]XP_031815781.1 oocyte zinc finger protein XlCOF19 [Sarcophilus harrisii]XP_031815845.1 oocyte zinc finger protein XlCOF19 [Sarcophilus harrisii]
MNSASQMFPPKLNFFTDASAQDKLPRENPCVSGLAEAWECGSKMGKVQENEEKHPETEGKSPLCNESGNPSSTQDGTRVCQSKEAARAQRVHNGERSSEGPEGGKVFCRRLTHPPPSYCIDRYYSCTHCEEAFCRVSDLAQHVKTHSEEKNYKCHQCGKDFYSSSGLTQHKKFHTAVKLFQCNECSRAFRKNKQLARHQRVHNGEKLHKCKECGKGFFENKALTVHQRIHSGEKPYECSACGRAFRRNSHLTRHQKTHAE